MHIQLRVSLNSDKMKYIFSIFTIVAMMLAFIQADSVVDISSEISPGGISLDVNILKYLSSSTDSTTSTT